MAQPNTTITIIDEENPEEKVQDRAMLKGGEGGDDTFAMFFSLFVVGIIKLAVLFCLGLSIFGIIAIAVDDKARSSDDVPEDAKYMWIVCLLNVIAFAIGIISKGIKSIREKDRTDDDGSTQFTKLLDLISLILYLMSWVWSLDIFVKMDNTDKVIMDNEYHLLWLYFQMQLWTYTTLVCFYAIVLAVSFVWMTY